MGAGLLELEPVRVRGFVGMRPFFFGENENKIRGYE